MIRAYNISQVYKVGDLRLKVIKNVSLEIAPGKITAIVGKSGSGKSTLLRMLGLLEDPYVGEIFIKKINVSNLDKDRKTKLRLSYLGYIFQDYDLLSELTAFENVFLPGKMIGSKNFDYKGRAKELLEIVDLKNRLNHRSSSLSGGEQQRVAIARALINDPEIIIADEPTASLDSIASEKVMNIFRTINSEFKKTIIFVSHDPTEANYADEIIVLKDGQIISN